MRICIYGSGAVGSHLAARLLDCGQKKTSLIARGQHLEAIRRHGIRLVENGTETLSMPFHATDDPGELPPQDIIFVCLKAHDQGAAATRIAQLLAPDGYAVFVNNGIPWWWNADRPDAGPMLRVDPDGALWRLIGAARAIGCVVNSANEVLRPGMVLHRGLNRWFVGEPDNRASTRLARLVSLLREAGLNAEASTDIRRRVWAKLMRNVPLNSLSALTRLDVAAISQSPALMKLARSMRSEVMGVAAQQGYDLSEIDQQEEAFLRGRLAGTRPSMLQDALKGRPMEIDAILGGVQSFAQSAGLPIPTTDLVITLLYALNQATACATGAPEPD